MTPLMIHDLLIRDPRTARLANNGQARIASEDDQGARRELRAEVESFVCRGQFVDALERVLERYLANLDASRQDSVWVSGFFGSGKSHLLKMFAHLWANTRFEDGATARGLVPGGLPAEVQPAFRELDTRAQRTGKRPVAAAGTLLGGNVDHVRLAVLAILLRAQGWPSQYPQARFCLWLREEGLLDQVKAAVSATGKAWSKELNNLYVSPVIARALIATSPNFAADDRAAHQLLRAQFPRPGTDITTEQFTAVARQVLAPDGEVPLTVLVLDEVQQYINEVGDRSAAITELAEAIQTEFSSRVLLVASGQSALAAGTDALRWLSDRFRISVQLTDAEVETVTREVLLRKKATANPRIEKVFEVHAGEVARHLQGTRLAVRNEDKELHGKDYPLLRTRRRFWEACFQAADLPGTHSQLRSQLRILHDSLQRIAERELGAVIPANDLYEAMAPDLVNSGVLLNEVSTRIAKLADGTEAGERRRDLCGVAFLIGKLPREGGADLGLRANADTLADLLVDDVAADSGIFRKRVSDTLEELASEGILMKVAGEYRIQTTAGADWDRAFRERRTALGQSPIEEATRRGQLLRAAVEDVIKGIRLRHGDSKVRRKLGLYVDKEPDGSGSGAVPVWLRDAWSCRWSEVRGEARRRGLEDPVIHVHLPKRSAAELRRHILDEAAAGLVLDERGVPTSAEGREAYDAMKSRRAAAQAARDGIVRQTLLAARVLQGGGHELYPTDLHAKIEEGAGASLIRLFPRFPEADHRAWGVALKRARQGSDTPFRSVDWDGPTEEHPVAKETLKTIGTGKRGSAIRTSLEAPPYGWPRDAMDAALVSLHRSGHLHAERDGNPVLSGALDQTAIPRTTFRPERIRLTTRERIALRGLFQEAGFHVKPGREEETGAEFLGRLRRLAEEAGGEAPLPERPDTGLVDDLSRLSGKEQLAAIFQAKEELSQAFGAWTQLGEWVRERVPAWELAGALRRHGEGLDEAKAVATELDAVLEQRSLLDAADPVTPCVDTLTRALRAALSRLRDAFGVAVREATERLAGDVMWQKLDRPTQQEILAGVGLVAPGPLSVATPEELRQTLDRRGLRGWQAVTDAVPAREAKALEAAAKRSEGPPLVIVRVRRGSLEDERAVREWVEEHERKLLAAVQEGGVASVT